MISSGAAWRETLASVLEKEMGFSNCIADHDLWMKACTKEDGSKYYAYICVYVDNLLAISIDPKRYIYEIKESFPIREDSIMKPKMYLRADTKEVKTKSGESFWCISANSYVKEGIRIIQERLQESQVQVKGKGRQPFSTQSY